MRSPGAVRRVAWWGAQRDPAVQIGDFLYASRFEFEDKRVGLGGRGPTLAHTEEGGQNRQRRAGWTLEPRCAHWF